MFFKFVILLFFLSPLPMKSETKCCYSPCYTKLETTTCTTQCPQVTCTQPLCKIGETLLHDPEGCNCPSVVSCPPLKCCKGCYPYWDKENCNCPKCVKCPPTCAPIMVTCRFENLKNDTCGCLFCDNSETTTCTTQCPQVTCTQPLCKIGETLLHDPEGCNCPSVVSCPPLKCCKGCYPYWDKENCNCPKCVKCPSTCALIMVTCRPENLKYDKCGCLFCDNSATTCTTQCPQVTCTQPLCKIGETLLHDPEGCNCPSVVSCPPLKCCKGCYPHWNKQNCNCPKCVKCPPTCAPIMVTCRPDNLKYDKCGCLFCDNSGTTTTHCPPVSCTHPFCYIGETIKYDPKGCKCPSVVSCPPLKCCKGCHPHWNKQNCNCPKCVECPPTCPPMMVTCPPESLRNDSCGCLLCGNIGMWY